jgi:hypothetical protein
MNLRLLRIGYIVFALAFMMLVVFQEWDKLQETEWQFRTELFIFATVGATAVYLLSGYGWHLCLNALGQRLPVSRSIRVWVLASLARYIPGGLWSLASRVALAKSEGVDVPMATLSLYIETILLMASSLAIGSLALLSGAGTLLSPLVVMGLCGLFALLLHPRVLMLARRLPGRIGKMFSQISPPSTNKILLLYGYYLLILFLFGMMFLGFVSSVHPVPVNNWVAVGASMPLAFFIGLAVLFAPSGFGVREPALYLLLLPVLSPGESLVVSIASRLWTLLAEAISVVAVLLYNSLARHR